MYSGSAVPARDYDLDVSGIPDSITSNATFTLTLKQPHDRAKRVINLDIKAISSDTVFHTEMQIVLTAGEPDKVHPIDKSNTPKFEFVNYTDFKGYDPEMPNGIAQSQFLFKLPINKHYKQLYDGETKLQWFRSFLPVNFLFNRIDKNDEPATLQPTYEKYGDSVVVSSMISSFDFIKYSNFIWNPKLTVLTFIRPQSRFQLQLMGNLYRLKIDSAKVTQRLTTQDSIISSVDTTIGLNRVWAYAPGLELYYDTHYTPDEFPFNFTFILGAQFVKLFSSEYTQADVAATSPDGLRKAAVLIDGNKRKFSAPIWTFSATIKKNLDLQKKASAEEDDHYLFFRFNYNWQSFNGNELIRKEPVKYEPKRLSNSFSQFQLGIDLNFDGFFK